MKIKNGEKTCRLFYKKLQFNYFKKKIKLGAVFKNLKKKIFLTFLTMLRYINIKKVV